MIFKVSSINFLWVLQQFDLSGKYTKQTKQRIFNTYFSPWDPARNGDEGSDHILGLIFFNITVTGNIIPSL